MNAIARLLGVAAACAALNAGAAQPAAAPFDLSALPTYQPTRQVTGTIRNFGFGMGGLLKLWEEDFRRFQPGITFVDRLPTSDAAIPALVTDTTDLAPDGGEPIITETLSFYETWGYHPTAITVASGAYDVEGLKPVALSAEAGGPFVAPSRESFQSRDYPLVRSIYFYLNRPPGRTMDPKLDEFLLFILSRQGQERLMNHGGYLPLTAAMVAAQRRQLEDPVATALSGTIRTWGHGRRSADILGGLVGAWQSGFQARYPQVRFETTLRGDDTAIGGLYTGAADIALMQRPPLAIELDGYLPVMGHLPQEVTVATGSLAETDHAFAPVILVHRANPLAQLTLAQLDAVLGPDRRRGGQPVRTWGDLGLGGVWKNAPITIYTFGIAQDVPQFIERAVMGGSQKWAARLHEFDDGRHVVDALARDRFGIAIAGLQFADARVKALALGSADGGPFVLATRDSVMQRRYPLTRSVSMFFDHAPGHPIDPKVAAYLGYLLSADGQAALARDGGYLPLSPDAAAYELEKLR